MNHCVNDIAVQGAVPLFFLDYFAIGKLDARVAAEVVSGIARGCKANGCALIGGETAEMPGFYPAGEYDLAGFIVGAVERKRMITGAVHSRPGDILLGLPSTGLHTNGYSLARKLLFEWPAMRDTHRELALRRRELLKLHRSYLKPLRALHDADLLKGAAHITGGGITDNTPRILPKGLGVRIEAGSWPVLPIFELLRKLGDIPEDDWRRTFNLGIGMIFVVSPRCRPRRKSCSTSSKSPGIRSATSSAAAAFVYQIDAPIGILLSGRGSNFLAIADAIDAGKRLDAEIAVVISNRADAPGIEIARARGTRRDRHSRPKVSTAKCTIASWLQNYVNKASNWSSWPVTCAS